METFSYSPGYIQCPICGEWYNAIYSSSDPNYKPHRCPKEKVIEKISELSRLLED